ncbi:MAG: hypothetical protein N4A63_02555 [Vallitalea sp.]|jgi:hypothetical protein|nr:hypothetical protein [Vallitalea sp.]
MLKYITNLFLIILLVNGSISDMSFEDTIAKSDDNMQPVKDFANWVEFVKLNSIVQNTEKTVNDLIIGQVELPDKQCTLQLQMYEGNYYIEQDIGPFKGTNYYGNCKLILRNDEEIIDEYLLDNDWLEKMRFNKKFEIKIYDYNKDGKIEFLIGQYLSNNINEYKLYRIDNNKIVLVDGDNYFNISGKKRYSCLFDFDDSGKIYYNYYDNSKGEKVNRFVEFTNENVIKK